MLKRVHTEAQPIAVVSMATGQPMGASRRPARASWGCAAPIRAIAALSRVFRAQPRPALTATQALASRRLGFASNLQVRDLVRRVPALESLQFAKHVASSCSGTHRVLARTSKVDHRFRLAS